MTKSTTGVLLAILTAVIIGSFISFLWCLRKLHQEDSENPDDFNVQCPASSYKILDNRNVTIKCNACPECPPGHGLTPPCGSTIFRETTINCTMCISSVTFSEEHSSDACKPCQSCGLRDTISPCTPQKNTQCGHCPWGLYQVDLTMESCKRNSSCRGRRSLCNWSNCVQQMENKQKPALTLRNIIPIFTTPGKVKHEKRTEHQSILQGGNFFKDGDLNNAGNMVSEDFMSQVEKPRFKREDGATLREAEIIAEPTTNLGEANFISKAEYSNPIAATKASSIAEEKARSLPATKSNFETAEQNDIEPTMPLNSSYFGDLKKRMNILIAIASFVLLVLTFIAVIVICNFWKRMKSGQAQGSNYNITCCVKYTGDKEEYRPVLYHSTPQSDSEYHEGSSISDNMVGITSCETDADTDGLERLALTEIPLDLMDLLAIKLDGRRNGERLYGWQKVGRKLNIERDVLINLENEYITPAGSPTRQLLALLGCKGRTVAELVNALNSSDVDHADTASFVQKHFRDQRN